MLWHMSYNKSSSILFNPIIYSSLVEFIEQEILENISDESINNGKITMDTVS